MEAIRNPIGAYPADVLASAGKSDGQAGILARAQALLNRQLSAIRLRRRMAATRDSLESLDDRMLKDIGLRRMELHSAVSSLYDSRVQGLPRMPLRERY